MIQGLEQKLAKDFQFAKIFLYKTEGVGGLSYYLQQSFFYLLFWQLIYRTVRVFLPYCFF